MGYLQDLQSYLKMSKLSSDKDTAVDETCKEAISRLKKYERAFQRMKLQHKIICLLLRASKRSASNGVECTHYFRDTLTDLIVFETTQVFKDALSDNYKFYKSTIVDTVNIEEDDDELDDIPF